MNQYELLYIVSNHFTDAEIEEISKQTAADVTKLGGTILASRNIGKIRLAYPIKKQRHGTYVLSFFDAEPEIVTALNRKLTLTDEILRHTIVLRQPDAKIDTYEITSYVAPLSEEARKERQKDRPEESTKPTSRREVEELAPPTPSATSTKEVSMSMEELDKKLDEILEADVTENI